MALYDLDNFRAQIKENGLLEDAEIDAASIEQAMKDDVALLKVGMQWVKQVLFER